MSKYKHTPGPWKVKLNAHPTTDGSSWGWVGQDKIRQLDEIPGVNVTWEEGRISEANAQLIAAAPELLSTLRALALSMRAHPDNLPNSEFEVMVDRAFDIIEKATGE